MNELLLICIKGSDALSSVVVININYYNSIIIMIIKINTISVLVNLKMMMMFNSCIFLPKQLSSYISLYESHRSGRICMSYKWAPCHHNMVQLEVADGGYGFQICNCKLY
jgi:hypothetical protein